MVKENLQVTLVVEEVAKGILDFDLITVRCGEEVISHRDGCPALNVGTVILKPHLRPWLKGKALVFSDLSPHEVGQGLALRIPKLFFCRHARLEEHLAQVVGIEGVQMLAGGFFGGLRITLR